LEGGGLYQLTRDLRHSPEIEIDFRPSLSEADLRAKLRTVSDKNPGRGIRRNWRLTDAVSAVIEEIVKPKTLEDWIRGVKHCRLTLDRPRPIEEAISCGGGVPWGELTPDLMLRAVPGAFCAGEMVDWDAPTGGYLLQGCLATATVAGEGVVKWIAQHVQP
jgi:predicted flavoprotein YhiN